MGIRKYKSVYTLQNDVFQLVAEGDGNLALKVVHDFVETIITEPLCVSQIFGSKALDDLCQQIGKANLSTIKGEVTEEIPVKDSESVYIYIVTKLQKSGGHTRIIEDLIMARPEAKHIILSTELDGKSDSDYVLNGIAMKYNVKLEQAPNRNYQQKLTWLQKRLVTLQPTGTYLLNHHQDSVAVAAIQPEMGLKASFYHHGDHHLCLGVYLSHLEHIDFHPMGYHYCHDELGIDNVYIPLAVSDRGARNVTEEFLQDGTLTTCTAARSNKVEIPYFVSYIDLVPKLLKETGGKHIHIGRLTPWALFKIRRGLKRYSVPAERFVYIPWVTSVWKALHDYQVDLYIASFPYGGGLTLVEAMGAGIPVVIHKHIFSRVLSCIELAYPEAYSWRYPDELLNYCRSLTVDNLKNQSGFSRIQYEMFHQYDDFQIIIRDGSTNSQHPQKLSENFFVDTDEWAAWMANQVTLRNVWARFIYRLYRWFRAIFQKV